MKTRIFERTTHVARFLPLAIALSGIPTSASCTPPGVSRESYAVTHTIAFTRDGKHLLVGEWMGDVAHKNCVQSFKVDTSEQVARSRASSTTMALSPSNDTLVSGIGGAAGYLIWDARELSETRKVFTEGSSPGKLVYDLTGKILAYDALRAPLLSTTV